MLATQVAVNAHNLSKIIKVPLKEKQIIVNYSHMGVLTRARLAACL